MIHYFPEVLNFNRLVLKFDRCRGEQGIRNGIFEEVIFEAGASNGLKQSRLMITCIIRSWVCGSYVVTSLLNWTPDNILSGTWKGFVVRKGRSTDAHCDEIGLYA